MSTEADSHGTPDHDARRVTPSVQLYSVRDAIKSDLHGTVARLAQMGFTQVEPYSFVDRADEYARAFASFSITAPSGHLALIDSPDPRPAFDAAARLGVGAVIDPGVPSARWLSVEDAYRLADRVNELQAAASAEGLRFGYHNHDWEFSNRSGDRPVFEYFVERLSPEVVLEIDVFWSTVGGVDTPELLRRLGDRVQFLHVKDGPLDAVDDQTPAGRGDMDLKAVLAAAPHALRIIEFDDYAEDVFDGIAESVAWLEENDR